MKCQHPDEALINDRPTPYCLACSKNIPIKKKKQHGGKRAGAGRPKLPPEQRKEPTKTVRIRISKLAQVLAINKQP